MLYKEVPIDNLTHVPGPVSQFSAVNEYKDSYNVVIYLAHFSMLNNKSLSKNIDVVQEQAPLIILDHKSSVCMDKNGKDTKHTIYISIIMQLLKCNRDNKNLGLKYIIPR